jgi:hypothetical protein
MRIALAFVLGLTYATSSAEAAVQIPYRGALIDCESCVVVPWIERLRSEDFPAFVVRLKIEDRTVELSDSHETMFEYSFRENDGSRAGKVIGTMRFWWPGPGRVKAVFIDGKQQRGIYVEPLRCEDATSHQEYRCRFYMYRSTAETGCASSGVDFYGRVWCRAQNFDFCEYYLFRGSSESVVGVVRSRCPTAMDFRR